MKQLCALCANHEFGRCCSAQAGGASRERIAVGFLVASDGLASADAFLLRLVVGFFEACPSPIASTPVWVALAEGPARLPAVFVGWSGASAACAFGDLRACSTSSSAWRQ